MKKLHSRIWAEGSACEPRRGRGAWSRSWAGLEGRFDSTGLDAGVFRQGLSFPNDQGQGQEDDFVLGEAPGIRRGAGEDLFNEEP